MLVSRFASNERVESRMLQNSVSNDSVHEGSLYMIPRSATFTTPWANSADYKLMLFYSIFSQKLTLTFHANCLRRRGGDSLHEMPNPIFWGKNISKCLLSLLSIKHVEWHDVKISFTVKLLY